MYIFVVYARRVPTLLKLNSVGLYLLLIEQVIYVYCKCHILNNFNST